MSSDRTKSFKEILGADREALEQTQVQHPFYMTMNQPPASATLHMEKDSSASPDP